MSKNSILPRGVKAVEWKNAASGVTSTRYRVRIVRAAESFKLDKLVETLDDAHALLVDASTPEGRKRIAKGRDKLTQRERSKDIAKHVEEAADVLLRKSITDAAEQETTAIAGPSNYIIGTPMTPQEAERDALLQSFMRGAVIKAANGRLTTLGHIVKRYVATHLDQLASPASINIVRENHRTRAKLMKLRLENAIATRVRYMPPEKRLDEPLVGDIAKAYESKHAIWRPLGDTLMHELDKAAGEAYIAARMAPFKDKKGVEKTLSPLTVRREIVDLNAVINDLEESDPGMWKVMGGANFFFGCLTSKKLKSKGRSSAKSDGAKRWRRVDETEEELLLRYLTTGTIKLRRTAEEIANDVKKTKERKRNPELVLIFRLAVATGMRASECVLLEWSSVKLQENSINLTEEDTKKGARRVLLNADARQVLAEVRAHKQHKNKRPGRLFDYTAGGFKGMFRRIRKESGVEDLVFHDLRRTAISRTREKLPGISDVEFAQAFGIQDVEHFRENMLEPIKQAEATLRGEFADERHARQSEGHAGANMTNHYATITRGRVPVELPEIAPQSRKQPKQRKPRKAAK